MLYLQMAQSGSNGGFSDLKMPIAMRFSILSNTDFMVSAESYLMRSSNSLPVSMFDT